MAPDISSKIWVALRKESVDRNPYLLWQFGRAFWSLSARRAWIEITHQQNPSKFAQVALRKESVDRNLYFVALKGRVKVALRKESVDRNGGLMSVVRFASGRSPQGERG